MASNRKFNVPVNLVSLASDPASADEGDVYYNTTDDRIRVYKNSTWVNLAYENDSAITSTDYITFDTTPETSSTDAGTVSWDSGDGLLKLVLNPNVELGIGQESVALVKNDTGSSIPKGSVVYVNGAQGQRPKIALADADTAATSSKTFGITAETIADEAEGYVVTEGVLRGLNTNGMTEGGAVWLSSTAGGYTQTIPARPAHSVFLGYVIKANASSGEIFVKIQNGYELEELHNVLIDGTPADNEVLAYDSASGLWKNQTSAEAGLIDTSSTAQTKSGNFTAAEVSATTKFVAQAVGGDEGGEILLGKPATNSTIAGTGVTIDVWQNRLRFFEQGGDARGYYIDITGGGNGVGTNLVSGGSASNSFTTISTPSGTSPVADSSTDTLTLTAGTGITITGDSSADSITIATTGLAPTSGKLSQFAATTSSELAGVISDETGTGTLVFNTSPTFSTRITVSSAHNNAIEIGRTDTSSTPFIDFRSSGLNTDFDTRILASGGTVGTGGGTLSITAATLNTSGDFNINGSNIGSSTSTFNLLDTGVTTLNFAGAATTANIGYDGTASSTTNISTGATASGATKTVNLGTGGVTGSTVNVNIGTSLSTTTINSAVAVFGGTIDAKPALPANASSASEVGYMGMPQVTNPSSPYNITASDAGKHIYMTTTGRTITLPANGTTPLEIGTTIVIINAASVSTTISITTDTLILAGVGTTGSRTLASNGMATCVKITSTSWIISGNGLS